MWFEIAIGWFIILCLVFMAFYIPLDGSHWQKHKYLGPFARFIQHSPARSFFIIFIMMLLMAGSSFLILQGFWVDTIVIGGLITNTVPIVSSLLLFLLVISITSPILWGRFRIWRQSIRVAQSEDDSHLKFSKTLDEFAEQQDIARKTTKD
jgi:hypothetical protein